MNDAERELADQELARYIEEYELILETERVSPKPYIIAIIRRDTPSSIESDS